METEQHLIDAIRSGDPQATRRLYDRFSGYTMAIGLRFIPRRDDVRDVLQESFVKILTSIDKFDYKGEGSLKNWVSKIVANCAIDWLKEHERVQMTNKMPEEEAADDEDPDVDLVPPDILNEMIGQLPTGCRMVVHLHNFEQLSHVEIARRLGVTENTSASQFYYAKKLLVKMIDDYLNSHRK